MSVTAGKVNNMDDFNIDARVKALALEQDRVAQRLVIARQMRQRFYEQYVQPYDEEIAALDDSVAKMEHDLREDTLAYALETGDFEPHSHITVRQVTKLQYDKAAVLATMKERGVANVIRVKEELDVRAFERDYKNGHFPGLDGVEQVVEPQVVLSKLGDLVITGGSDNGTA